MNQPRIAISATVSTSSRPSSEDQYQEQSCCHVSLTAASKGAVI